MSGKISLSLAVLDRIGAPLMAAVAENAARAPAPGAAPEKPQAEQLAALIGKSVQAGIALAGSMDLRDAADGDAVRIALAAIAAPLVAARFRASGQVPGDNDVKEIVAGLEAVLTFADSFAGVPAAAARLEGLAAAPADESQAALNCIRAMVPVVEEISVFAFGRPEKKLAQEIAARLLSEAAALAAAALPGAQEAARKAAALDLLGPLAGIYAACHRAETKRILAMDEKARQEAAQPGGGLLPLEPVWEAFGRRAAMLAVLGEAAAGAGAATVPASAQASPLPPAASPAQEDAGASPFSAFVGKPAAEADAVPAAPPPAASAPPPAAAQPAENLESPAENPMSFFASGAKKKSDETGSQQ
jgi:hypothetical protein